MTEPAIPLVSSHVPDADPLPAPPKGTTLDQLLTPTGNTNDPAYVHLGNLLVERNHLADFEAAQRYLGRSPEAVSALYALEHAPQPVTLKSITDGNDRYNGAERAIYWDPKSALLNANGTAATPALGLLHEQGHAIEHALHPDQYIADVSTKNQRYNTAEEQRVITGLETRVARDLGEGTRKDHGGIAYEVAGPTQVQALPGRALEGAVATAQLNALLGQQKAFGYSAPPNAAAGAVTPWDGKAHSGTIVHLDEHTVAQHTGRGQYQLYDVQKDLHGITPPENIPTLTIDTHGVAHHAASTQQHSMEFAR
jgi:hypothetical protein